MRAQPFLSIVVPAYDEEESLGPFLEELLDHAQTWDFDFEVIVIDDGSKDDTWRVLMAMQDSHIRCIRLAKNSGHQIALEVGYLESRGDYVVTMDADGQHPANAIDLMIEKVRRHKIDVVYGIPMSRKGDSAGKRWSSFLYYWFMRRTSDVPIITNAADFRLVSRRVVDIVNSVHAHKVHRLLIPALQLPSSTVVYELKERSLGQTKYSPSKMIRLAVESVIQYSTRPLRLLWILGLISFTVAAGWIAWVLVDFASGRTVAGWASQMSITLALGGIIMLSLGLLAQYLATVIDIVKATPRYVIQERSDKD